jgi:hypothetical protein
MHGELPSAPRPCSTVCPDATCDSDCVRPQETHAAPRRRGGAHPHRHAFNQSNCAACPPPAVTRCRPVDSPGRGTRPAGCRCPVRGGRRGRVKTPRVEGPPPPPRCPVRPPPPRRRRRSRQPSAFPTVSIGGRGRPSHRGRSVGACLSGGSRRPPCRSGSTRATPAAPPRFTPRRRRNHRCCGRRPELRADVSERRGGRERAEGGRGGHAGGPDAGSYAVRAGRHVGAITPRQLLLHHATSALPCVSPSHTPRQRRTCMHTPLPA